MLVRLERESEPARVVTDLLLADQLEGDFLLMVESNWSLEWLGGRGSTLGSASPSEEDENHSRPQQGDSSSSKLEERRGGGSFCKHLDPQLRDSPPR